MTTYDDIFKNPLYIKWVFNSTPELELYWEEYIDQHPEEAPLILELKNKLRNIKLEDERLTEEEKLKLAYQISKKLDKEDKRRNRRYKIGNLFKYAAVAVIFFSIGGLVVYMNLKQNDLDKYMRKMEIPFSVPGPMLILSDGKNVAINNGESTLDYTHSGEILLNKDSVISAVEPSKISQLVMPHGSSSKVVLNDSTIVWLNAGSSLIYPSTFTQRIREVVLFGEAYFNVSKNTEKPFIVRTTALEIKVLGTEFNVSAYPEDNIIQTVLKEGSVAIRRIDADKEEKDLILKPNQLASYDKTTKKSNIQEVNTDFYTLWTDGLLCFENRDLNRVVKTLERYYDIVIHFDDPLLGSVKISGKLVLNQNREEVFEYLEKVSSTKFEKVNDKYYRIK